MIPREATLVASLLGNRQTITDLLKETNIGQLKIKVMIPKIFEKDLKTPKLGEVRGCIALTKDGVYLYKPSQNSLAEIIGFIDEEAKNKYRARCTEIYNKYFSN